MAPNPARAAAIDVGTNTVLLTIAERRGAELVPLAECATITRLGRGVDRTRRLSADAAERTLLCLGEYARTIHAHRVDALDVVGTSALRDAKGADDFLERAEQTLGVRPRVISGAEEARLTFSGALSGLSLAGPVSVFDIGGGSTEIIDGVAGTDALARAVSLDIGSVRLHERHITSDPPSAGECQRVLDDIRSALSGVTPPPPDATSVGVAGTVTTLAALAASITTYDAARVHGARLSAAAIEELCDRLAQLSVAERRALPGLQPERADVILCGALIAREVLRWSNARAIAVSDRGVRWGLLQRRLSAPAD